MLLHGIGTPNGESPIIVQDSLLVDPGSRWSLVLTNPPFGKKSSLTMVGADGREVREDTEIERQDFVATTSNKQLNFVQHIMTILDINGRAAVVLPDNVLFEGGAGETIRRKLLTDFDLHTMLRLPTGIFYAQGVKANVLFFDRKPARPERPWTERLWVYDLRTNQHFTLKQNPLRREHLDEFVDASGRTRGERVESERWHSFSYDELVARDKANLDITWLATSRWRTWTTCRARTSSPARSSRTCRRHWPSSKRWRLRWRRSCRRTPTRAEADHVEEYRRIRQALVEHADVVFDLIAGQLATFGSKGEWSMDEVLDATDELVRLAERVGLPPAGDQDASALAFYRAASGYAD